MKFSNTAVFRYLIVFSIVLLPNIVKAQLSGNYTIGAGQPYITLTSIVSALNTQGVAAAVTVNIPAGYTETAPSLGYRLGSATLNASLSATNTLTFQKSGTGANPVLTAQIGTVTGAGIATSTTGYSGIGDGIFSMSGTDYVTIDGIDLIDPSTNTTASKQMEWGYGFFKLNATAPFDGCQYNTVKNCTITMMGGVQSSGIVLQNLQVGASVALVPTATTDANSYNKIYSNTIQKVGSGIYIKGYFNSTNLANWDKNNDFGGSSAGTGNTIKSFGPGANANISAGIYALNQLSLNASYNTINNYNSGATINGSATVAPTLGTCYMIYNADGTLTSGLLENATIKNNTLTLTAAAGSTTMYGLYQYYKGGDIDVSNNTLTFATTGTSIGSWYGIYSYYATVGSTGNFKNNTLTGTIANSTGTIYGLYFYGNSQINVDISGNTVNNLVRNAVTTGTLYGIYGSYSLNYNVAGYTTNIYNNTVYNVTYASTATSGTIYSTYFSGNYNLNIYNNTVSNITNNGITATGSIYGLDCYYYGTNVSVYGNNVSGITTTSTGTVYTLYDYFYYGANVEYYNNSISNITASGSTAKIYAWYKYYNGGNYRNHHNVIKNIQNTSATAGSAIIYGAYAANYAGFTSNGVNAWYNNIISIGNNAAGANASTNSSGGYYGFYVPSSSASTLQFYYNTVSVFGTSSQAAFSAHALYNASTTTATKMDLRNNLFMNYAANTNAAPTSNSTCVRLGGALATYLATTYDANSNFNNFYLANASGASTAYYYLYDGTTGYNTIASMKGAIGGREAKSFEENTPFLSTVSSNVDFFKPIPNTITQIESGAQQITSSILSPNGITTDFSNAVRQGNVGYTGASAVAPDMGAYEFDGTACPHVAMIKGPSSMYLSSNVTMYDSTLNGKWYSSNPSIASIDSNGVVRGLSIGTANLFYIVNLVCGPDTAKFSIAVIPNPCLPSYVPTNGLVGWWPFCGNANDESGNGNNGAAMNGVALTNDRNGNANSAYYFDGVDDYINVGTINGLTSYTISLWSTLSSFNFQYLIGLGINLNNTTDVYKGYGIGYSSMSPYCGLGASKFFICDGSSTCSNWIESNTTFTNINKWINIIITSNVNGVEIYANGVKQIISSNFSLLGILNLKFGTRSDLFTYFNGNLDDIGVWNRALSASEIQALYLSGQPCPSVASIQGPTNVNVGNTISLTDSTANGKWTSSNPSIASIDSIGKVMGHNVGTTIISYIANLGCGPDTAFYTVTVNSNPCLPSYVPTNGLVGWWPFCGNANDESGNGHNGTVNGATLTSDRFGHIDQAYNFDLVNGQLSNITTSYIGVLGNNNRSISLWIKEGNSYSNGALKFLCYYGLLAQYSDFQPTWINGTIGVASNNSAVNYYPVCDKKWQHCVVTYDNADGNTMQSVKVYLNSVLISNISNGLFFNSNMIFNTLAGYPFIIGSKDTLSMFKGKMDDIGFWNRALTQQEITALYLSGQPCPSVASIQGPMNVNVGSTITLTDSTANGTWSSSNTAVATINASGMVTGLTAGTTTISYIANLGCGPDTALYTVTVNANPCLPSYVPTNGLVGWWPFCGNANDESGNGNNGTVNGATLTSDRNGNTGSAYSFNGYNSFISTPASFTTGNSEKSFSVWLKLDSLKRGWIIAGGNDINGQAFGLFMETYLGDILFHGNGSANDVFFLNTHDTMHWINLVVTYSGNTIKNYCNGLLINQMPNALNTALNNIIFGRRNNPAVEGGFNAFIKAKLDDIGVWNRALTPQEIQALYLSGQPCPSVANILGPTNVNVGSSITLTDSTANGTWSSSNTAVATINASGVVTGLTAGTTTISYIANLACGADTAMYTVTVNSTCLPGYVPTNGLVGYWPFCGNANDESGNGNHGTVNGATLTSDRFGNINGAYQFAGNVNSFIQVANSPSLDITGNQITISTWIYSLNANNDQNHKGISKGGWGLGSGYELLYRNSYSSDSGALQLSGANGGLQQYYSINSLNGKWVHLVGVYNNGVGYFYVNGKLILPNFNGQQFTSFVSSNYPLIFGKRTNGAALQGFVNGNLDDIGIWNRALTPAEIQALYLSGQPCPSVASIQGPANVNAGSTITLTDSTANGTWSSSNTAVATVDASGIVTGLTAGTTTISYIVNLACGADTATYTVTVNSTCLPGYVPTNGLVGWWPFCGNANDESGNGNNGTAMNGVALTNDRNGNANSAYYFDGVDDYVNMPSGSGSKLNLNTDFSVTFWTKTLQGSGAGIIGFGDNLNSANGGYLIAIGNGLPAVGKVTAMTGNTWYAGNNQLIDNSWHFVSVVLCNNVLSIKIDNFLDVTINNVNTPVSFNGLRTIGSRNNGLAGFFNGKLDDIGLWNRALSASEIQALYLNACPRVASIQGPANVNAGSTITLTDSTANGTWSSSNPANATINASGVVTGLTAGTTTISYIANLACGADTAMYTVTVNSTCLPGYVPTNGLVGYWPFCGNANDESGNGNNGTVNGATLTTDRNGNANSAYNFDGNTSFIKIPNQDYSNFHSITVSCWVQFNNFLNGPRLVGGDCIGDMSCDFQTTSEFKIYHGRLQFVQYSSNIPNSSNWFHILYSVDSINNVSKIYCNGQLVSIFNSFHAFSVSDIYFGKHQYFTQSAAFLNGKLDDVAIYNRALSPAEIQALYLSGQPCPSIATIHGPNNVNIGSTITLTDSTAKGNWTSSNTAIATIDSLGTVTGHSVGTTTISYIATTACGLDTATYAITVNANPCLPSYVPTNGLVGWWPFCGNANDESGNGNNGIVNGATLTNDRFGNIGMAYDFNGVSDYIYMKNSQSLNITGTQLTMSTWINLPFQNINRSFLQTGISKGGWEVGSGYELLYTFFQNFPNTIDFQLSNNYGGLQASYNNFSALANNWFMLTSTFNNGTGQIYLNGTLISSVYSGSQHNNFFSNFDSLLIGVRNSSNNAYYYGYVKGKMDDIGIWNRALTPQEITALYLSGQPCPTIATIHGPTNVNAGSTITLTDSTANGTWSSSNPAVATINASGIVTGLTAGTTTISYIANLACGADTATYTVTVNSLCLPSYVPTNGLVGWWPFCGNANDESGNGNNGVSNQMNWGVDRFGNNNSDAEFNGIIQRAIRVFNPTVTLSSKYTFSFWFKLNGPKSYYNTIIDAGGSGMYCQIYGPHPSYISTGIVGKIGFSGYLGNNCSSTSVIDSNWHQGTLLIDWTGGLIQIYQDGKLDTIQYFTPQTSTPWTFIDFGQNFNNINDPFLGSLGTFAGSLDDIGIWNRALSPAEIQSLYLSGQPCPTIATIHGPTNVNVGSSITLTDSTANGTWSSSNTAVATINASGVVTGLTAGTTTISYIANLGCGPDTALYTVTVNANPCLPSYVPTNGLVGWWPFCGNANDESGNGNNGTTMNGVSLTADRNGNLNSAYNFDGLNDYIEVPNSSSLQNIDSITISAWININAWYQSGGSNYYPVLHKSSIANQYGRYALMATDFGGISHLKSEENGFGFNSWNLNQWYNLVVTISNNRNKIYINGTLVSNLPCGVFPQSFNTALPLQIGRDAPGLVEFTNGKLDDIGIWNRALTPTEIQALYLSGQPATCTPPVAQLTPSGSISKCMGDSVLITASPSPNGNQYSYQWLKNGAILSGATSSTLLTKQSGSYAVIVQDAACKDTSNATNILFNALPTVYVNSGAICSGSSGMNLTASGANTYQWLPATGLNKNYGASVLANPSVSTTYTIIGKDTITGCSNATSSILTVNPQPALQVNAASICAGSSVTLTATGANTYSWSPAAGLSATTGASVIASPSSTTVYSVTGTITATGCSKTVLDSVKVIALPNVSVNSPSICAGNSTTLTATGATTYSWSPSTGLSATTGASVTANPTATTTYTVTGTNANGCIKTASAIVTVNTLPNVGVNSPSICAGNSTTLTATGATTYSWSPSTGLSATSGASVTANPTATTTYTVTGTNANGCIKTASAIVTIKPTSTKTINASICQGASYTVGTNSYTTSGTFINHFTNYRGCDSAVTLNLTVKPTSTKTINASICQGSNYTVGTNNYTTSGTYVNHFTNYRGCDSAVTLNLIVKPTSTKTINASICQGSNYSVGTNSYTTSGTYVNHFTNYRGCDSAVTLNLIVKPTSANTINASICQGASYTVGTSSYTASGTYVNHFTNAQGCDSAVTLNLIVKPTSTKTINASICQGSSYTVGTSSYTASGTYVNHFTNAQGCDSAVTLNLMVKPNSSKTINASICQGTSYSVGANSYTTSGTYVNHFTNYRGCDSAVTLNLIVKPTSTKTINTSICQGASYTVGTNSYTTSGTYVNHFTNYRGCDSAVTLNLIVKPTSTNTINASICQGASYTVGTSSYTTSGTYVNHFTNYLGCDSAVTLNLTVKPTSTKTINASICQGASYTVGTSSYTASGTYVNHFTNYRGCDSAVTLNLIVKPTSANTINASICQGSSYSVGANSYTTSGTYVNHFTNYRGCDSAVTLNLTVKPTSTKTINVSICQGASYSVGANSYTTSGTYVNHFTNYRGCDSAVTLNLVVKPTSTKTINASICQGSNYSVGTNNYTTSGTYVNHFTNAQGCDSAVTLNLVVKPTSTKTINASICQGSNYSVGTNNYTTSGTYVNHFTNAQGCDSAVTLNLIVKPISAYITAKQLCYGQSYVWNNKVYTQTSQDTVILTNSLACDSFDILQLYIAPLAQSQTTIQLCAYQSYTWHNKTYAQSGTYVDTLQTSSGCDSITTLNLQIYAPLLSSASQNLCQGTSNSWQGQTITQAGTYYDTIPSVLTGCDSVLILNVQLLYPSTDTQRVWLCAGTNYAWNGHLLTQAGVYYDTIQNAQGCDSINVLEMNYYTPLTAQISGAAQICQGQSTSLSSSLQGSWQFNHQNFGSLSSSIQASQAGVYQLELLDSNGCQSWSDSFVLGYYPKTSINIQAQPNASICIGTSVSMTASGITNIQWNNNYSNSQVITPSTSQWYVVSGLDTNACSTQDSIQIQVNSLPAIGSILGNPTIVPFTIYTYVVNNINNTNYVWNVIGGIIQNGQGTNSVNVMWNSTGPYAINVMATNASGCSDSTSLAVLNSNCTLNYTIDQISNSPICQGDTVRLVANYSGTANYQWYKNGAPMNGETGDTLIITKSGSYQLGIVTPTCTTLSNGTIIYFNSLPSIPQIMQQSAVQTGCGYSSVTLATTQNYTTYQWSNGSSQANPIIKQSGVYSVIVSNASGCSTSSSPYALSLSNIPAPNLCIVTVDSISGKNKLVWEKLSKQGIDSFYIYKEQGALNNFVPLAILDVNAMSEYIDNASNAKVRSDRYTLKVKDTCGTLGLYGTIHQTIHLNINLGLGNSRNLMWNSYEGLPVATYNIYRMKANGQVSLLASVASSVTSYTDATPPAGTSSYFVSIVNPNGTCTPTARNTNYSESMSNIVTMTDNVGYNTLSDLQIHYYPNPANKAMIVEMNYLPTNVKEWRMIDPLGRVVNRGAMNSDRFKVEVDELPEGVYYLYIGVKYVPVVVAH